MKKIIFIFLLLISITGFSQPTVLLYDTDIKAFPGAIGHGQSANGFRGKDVYFVTNTTDGTAATAGSFKKALSDASSAGGGYIIFTTGGVLTYTGDPDIDSNIYLAGQTAPGGGYGFRATNTTRHQIWVRGSDVAIRHLRWYGGDANGQDCLTIGSTDVSKTTDQNNIIIDQNSFHWASDENVAFTHYTTAGAGDENAWSSPKWYMRNVSFTRNIVGEQYNSNYGMILYGSGKENFSIIGNLFINHGDRSPLNNGVANEWEYINNLVHWGGVNGRMKGHPQQKWNIIGNVHSPSVAQNQETYEFINCSTDNCPPSGYSTYNLAQSYYTDNVDSTAVGNVADYDTNITAALQGGVIASIASDYTPLSATNAVPFVLGSAGAGVGTLQGRDSLDLVYQQDYALDQGRYTQSNLGNGVGEPPTLAAGTPYTDTDSDGLSDQYELDQGGTTTSISNSTRPATAVIGDDRIIDQTNVTSYATQGYTHLDIFLADLAGDWDGFAPEFTPATSIVWADDVQSVSDIGNLDLTVNFTPSNATNKGVTYSSTNTGVVDNTGAVIGVGTCTLTVTADDTTNGTLTDDMSVTVYASETPGLVIKSGSLYKINGGTYKAIVN